MHIALCKVRKNDLFLKAMLGVYTYSWEAMCLNLQFNKKDNVSTC